jgi:hypothetical protein
MWIAELQMRALTAFTDPDADGGGNRRAGGVADMHATAVPSDLLDPARRIAIFNTYTLHARHAPPALSPGEKVACRNLFAGMFGLLRNRFAHNDAQPNLSDLDTSVANVNMCSRIVGDFREKVTE